MNASRFFFIIGTLVLLAMAVEGLRTGEEAKKMTREETRRIENAFREVEIEARAAFVYDGKERKTLYGKNEAMPLPLASLVKLMTALLAREAAPRETVVAIPREALGKEGDTGLLVGEAWPLAELVGFTLTTSSNDGAAAIAAAVSPFLFDDENRTTTFVEAMNRKAKELGFSSMQFSGETGLDEDGQVGGYGSARDVSFLLLYLVSRYPEITDPTAYPAVELRSFHAKHEAENTNKETDSIPGLVASKTGFTDLAGGNLSVVFERGPGHPVVVTVLGSSREGRFEDVRKLVERTLELPALIR